MYTWTTWELLYWVTVALLAGGLLSLMAVMVYQKLLDERAGKVVHEVPGPTYSLNSNRNVAVSNFAYWETDMKDCPRGVKVLMLGVSGVAILGQYNGDKFFVGWFALPRRRST